MTEQQFLPGDRAQYQGRGAVMDVVSTSGSLCYCRWVDASGQQRHGTFDCSNLTAVPANDKPAPAS